MELRTVHPLAINIIVNTMINRTGWAAFLILGICVSGCVNAYGQYLELEATRIPVYERPFVLKTDREVAVDTIRHNLDMDEEWYDFTIMESSALRFKIRYRLSEDCMLWSRTAPEPVYKYGWVDKKYMRVRLSGIRSATDDDCFDFRLYSAPADASPEHVFTFYIQDRERVDLPVVDVGEDGWLKVMFFCRGKYYEGWTRDYCDNFYSTCC